METTSTFAGLRCTDCGTVHDVRVSHRCPDCDGALDPSYDLGASEVTTESLTPDPSAGIAAYADLLPFPAGALVTAGEGATPLVDCPDLADALGVGAVYVKDEGHSTTGAAIDRGMALAVSAAVGHGASDVAVPSMGNGGQAGAAYAARAGIDSHSFVPSRTPFVNKAMINVHGGDMSVVGGRYADAAGAFADAMDEEDWHSLAPVETPYRHEGAKTLAYEIAAQLDWVAPDAVVQPTGHGTEVLGLEKGFRELTELAFLDEQPRLCAAQAAGCAPIATAWEDAADDTDAWETPDTIVGPLEIPDPAAGDRVLDALEATGGAAIATPDQDILEGATSLAQAGVTMGASGGAAHSAAQALSEDGAFESDDVVVLVNPTSGNKEADVLRSHLMSKGI